MKFTKSISIAVVLIFSLALAFYSCKTSTSDKGSADTTLITKDSMMADLKDIVYPLPSPFELYKKLEDIGAQYVGKVLNPVENIDKYYTEKNKALNLGVYAADLSYVSTYNKTQEIQLYSKNLKTLTDQLNVNLNYQDFYNEETKKKLENKDSLIAYITTMFYDTYKSMAQAGDPELSVLMLSGIWAEGLYIATHISDNTFNNPEIVKIIYDQRSSLESLIEMMKKYSGDEVIDNYIEAFGKVKAEYDKTDGSLTKQQLDDITNAIATIRASIIS